MELNRLNKNNYKEILHKIKSESIHIQRVPKTTKEKFIKLANDEFCGDYGMLIKFLIDGLVDPDFQAVYRRISDLEEAVGVLQETPTQVPQEQEPEQKKVKLLNGKEIKK